MKRWITFLAIFAVGLAVLLWIDRGRKREERPPEPQQPGLAPDTLTEIPTSNGRTSRGALRGPQSFDTFDIPGSGKLLYRTTAENAEPLGDNVYRLDKVVLRIYVRGTDELRALITAETARAKLTIAPTFGFDPAYEMQLDDVVATLRQGSPFVPIELRLPHATGSLAEPWLRSTDRVDVVGHGLTANGTGLSYSGARNELELQHDAVVNLELEDGTPASLNAPGGLTVTRVGDPKQRSTHLVAKDHAHLEFGGKQPLMLDANEITLDADVTNEKDRSRVVPKRVSARGGVVLAPKDGKFFGDAAELTLDKDARPSSAKLEGSPRVSLALRDVGAVPGVQSAPQGELPVEMTGAGPLEVALGEAVSFDFKGPAKLVLPTLDLSLDAREKLSGTRAKDASFARLDASGAVEARSGGTTLSAPALSVERVATPDSPGAASGAGKVAAKLVTQGNTHAAGPLPSGGEFDLLAGNGLELVRTQESIQVPIARDVDLAITGMKPMHAKAKEIHDLDERTRTLVGIGDVSFDNGLAKATGQRVEARGEDSVLVLGAPTQPAHADFPQGTLDAETLDFHGDRLRAEGAARANVGAEGSDYRLDARWIEIARTPNGAGFDVALEAGGSVDAHVAEPKRKLAFTSEFLHADAFSPGPTLKGVEHRGLEASGRVEFHVSGDESLDGKGEHLVIAADDSGTLTPASEERVELRGRLPKDDLAFEMSASEVRFAPENLSAGDPVVEIQGVEVPIGRGGGQSDTPLYVVAGAMSVDPTSMLFTQGVYVGQRATPETTWSLDAENLVLTGARQEKKEGEDRTGPRFQVSNVLAWGGFQARFADRILARGAELALDRGEQRMTMRGSPSQFDLEGWRVSSDWTEVDLATGFWRSSKGSAVTLDESKGAFELRFASMEPMSGVDSRIEIVREPSFIDHKTSREIRAAWALFWFDERRLERLSLKLQGVPEKDLPEVPDVAIAPSLSKAGFMKKMRSLPFLKWVHEAYFEGNLEMIEKGERLLRADSMYLNLVDGRGWLSDLIVTRETPFKSAARHLKLHAGLLEIRPDGSMASRDIVATSCEFDDPHYTVKLGDLRIKPQRAAPKPGTSEQGEIEGYEARSKNNSVRFGGGPNIPLPQIDFPMGPNFEFSAESLQLFGIPLITLGSFAKFGTVLGLTFDVPLGGVSKLVSRLLGKNAKKPEGRNTADVKYLNSRGLLLMGRNSLSQKGVYELTTRLAAIYDTGRDKGLVRVPKDDRDSVRTWLRIHGRRWLGANEWFDLNLTQQSDPGVQAEFFEREFLRWEERETYLHYRHARGLDYWRATLETQLDNHRTEVLEEPSFGYTRSRNPIARILGHDVVYTSDTTLAHLRRVEPPFQPFNEPPFPDGLGEREVDRVDTDHRFEWPMPLGVLGARFIPFVEGRATAWDQGQDKSDTPSRFAALVGADVSATFWKLLGDGDMHTLTPSIGFKKDLAVEDNDGTPVQYDGVEDPLEGEFTELGLRSRWVKPLDPRFPDIEDRFLDIELRQAYAEHLTGGRDEGWQPLRVNAQWLTQIGSMPFGVQHDARYDLENHETIYSRSAVGIRPWPRIEIEPSFNFARDLAGDRLYSTWGVKSRYSFSRKWQIEGEEQFSTSSDRELASSLLLRRIGHDFVVELEYSFTAGEGSSSFSVSWKPMLFWREPRLGILRRWQEQGN